MKKFFYSLVCALPLSSTAAASCAADSITIGGDPVEEPVVQPGFRYGTQEIEYLNDSISFISSIVLDKFDVLYAEVKRTTTDITSGSELLDSPEYNMLLQFCKEHSELQFVLFRKIGEDETDILAAKLILDIAQALNQEALELARQIYESSINSLQSLSMAYAKIMISNS